MLLSVSLDLLPEETGASGFRSFADRLSQVDGAGADLILLGRETNGKIRPGRVEGLVTMPWAAERVRRAALAAVLPGLHGLPFHVARALSAIDFVSGGRAGWAPICGERAVYDRAYGSAYRVDEAQAVDKYDDFIAATQALWDSWDDDALIIDKASGEYLDSTKVRRVAYKGPYFSTMGPLNAARPVQGYPLLVRDMDDLSASAKTPADILLVSANDASAVDAIRAAAPGSPAILLKAAAGGDLAALAKLADGIHLSGLPDAAQVTAARALLTPIAANTGPARERFGFARPVNPFTERTYA